MSVILVVMGTLPPAQAAAALLIIWIAAIPGLIYLQGWVAPPVPLLPFAGLYYILFFGLPAFAAPLAYRAGEHVVMYMHVVLDVIETEVLLLIAAGIASMWFGYYVSRKAFFARLPALRVRQSDVRAKYVTALYVVLLGLSLSYRYLDAMRAIPSIGQFLDPVGYLALGGLFLQWRAGELSPRLASLLLIVVVPLEFLWRIRFAFLTDILMLAMFFGFILWRERCFRAIGALAAFGVCVLLLYSAAGPVRTYATSSLDQSVRVVESFGNIWRSEGRENFVGPDGTTISWDRRLSPIVNRLAQVWIFQAVYERSPDSIPYWTGQTYAPLLTSFIPRLIYPEKPEERAGGDFGHRYGFLPPDQQRTSVNIPWIVELLANFGWSGVLIGMALFGVFLSFLDKIFNRRGMDDIAFLIGLTMIFRLGYQESNFSVMTGSLPMLFVCLYLFFRVGPWFLRRFAH